MRQVILETKHDDKSEEYEARIAMLQEQVEGFKKQNFFLEQTNAKIQSRLEDVHFGS